MVGYRHPYIAREGWGLIGLVLAMAVSLWWWLGVVAATPVFLLAGFLIYFFRDPKRRIPASPLGVVSPVDGRVCEVGEATDPFLPQRDKAKRIALRQHPLGVRSLRCPIEGKVMERWHKPLARGGFVTTYWIRTDEGDDLAWVVIGPVRWVRIDLQPGERVGQGQRCGFAYFPVKTILYLPLDTRINVEPGDRVLAGQRVLAEFIHRRPMSLQDLEMLHASS